METYFCYRCDATKSHEHLRQVEEDETCLYACRQCGSTEGVWLERQGHEAGTLCRGRIAPAPQTLIRLDMDQRQLPLFREIPGP